MESVYVGGELVYQSLGMRGQCSQESSDDRSERGRAEARAENSGRSLPHSRIPRLVHLRVPIQAPVEIRIVPLTDRDHDVHVRTAHEVVLVVRTRREDGLGAAAVLPNETT